LSSDTVTPQASAAWRTVIPYLSQVRMRSTCDFGIARRGFLSGADPRVGRIGPCRWLGRQDAGLVRDRALRFAGWRFFLRGEQRLGCLACGSRSSLVMIMRWVKQKSAPCKSAHRPGKRAFEQCPMPNTYAIKSLMQWGEPRGDALRRSVPTHLLHVESADGWFAKIIFRAVHPVGSYRGPWDTTGGK
jgi:hypothetical protein